MGEFALLGVVLRLVLVVLTLAGIVVGLRWYNRLTGDRFDAAFAGIVQDPGAASLYYGLRFVGICLLFGLVMG